MIQVVFVRLLGEGTVVFRPTTAEFLTDTTARLLPVAGIAPGDEQWEFEPGSLVRVEKRLLGEQEVLLAVSLGSVGSSIPTASTSMFAMRTCSMSSVGSWSANGARTSSDALT